MIAPRTYVDIHVLQTVPPSNINRDDAGSPKQALFGGVRRARVSSQAWKRAARQMLAEQQPVGDQATRTKRIAGLVAKGLVARTGVEQEVADRISQAVIVGSKIGMDKKKADQTSYLLFFGQAQVAELVGQIADRIHEFAGLDAKGLTAAAGEIDVVGVLGRGHPVDVALFGRMVADLAQLNVDSSTQVAHAISTHPVEIEFDYFTAVDDENENDETGAGMIGTVEFNAATLYRYATVAVHQLAENLTDPAAVVPAAEAFIDAFVKSIPSGHQNSFAHRTRPSLVLVVVREDQPVSLATAFEAPVRSNTGVEAESVVRLVDAFGSGVQLWGDKPVLTVASYEPILDGRGERVVKAVGDSVPFAELLEAVRGVLAERIEAPVSA